MKNIFKIIFAFLMVSKLNFAFGAVKLAPTLIELDANKTRGNYITTAFRVQADKDETIRFKLYPEYFTITNEGKMDAVKNSESKNNLASYVKFVPNEFTLKDGSSQTVRMTFDNIKNLPEGESRMVMFLEDVKAKEIILPNKNKDVSTKLIVKTRLGIPIYIDKGHYVKVGSFDELNIKKNEKSLVYTMNLSSKGNSKIRYFGKAQIIKEGKLIKEFPVKSNTVGANGIYKETTAIPDENLDDGEYIFKVVLTYKNEKGENKNLIKEVKFSINNSI